MDGNIGTSIVENILNGNHIEVWSVTITYLAYLMGLIFVIIGLLMFTKAGSRRGMHGSTRGGAITSMLAGFMLLSLQAFIAAGTYTMFADDKAGDYAFENGVMVIQDKAKGMTSGPEAIYTELVVYVLEIIGLVSVIKSAFLFREATQSSKATTGAIWHFIGGILALNFRGAVQLIGETGGPDVQSILSRLFG